MMDMTQVRAASAVRDARQEDIDRLCPGVNLSTAEFVLAAGSDGTLALAPEPFDSDALALSVGRIVHASASSVERYVTLFAEAARRARHAGYRQVLRRAPMADLREVWALERTGFELMDVGVTFARALTEVIDPPRWEDLQVRASTDDDIREIVDLMVRQPWGTRYEADPAYEASRVSELRSRWLWNSHRGRADVVFIGVLEGRPAGYVTCRLDHHTGVGDIELVGTVPAFRRRHVASRVIAHAISWFSSRSAFVTVRTQATNYAAAKVYERAGFTLHSSDLTFRLTVDPDRASRPSPGDACRRWN